jgi:hypothetical protein
LADVVDAVLGEYAVIVRSTISYTAFDLDATTEFVARKALETRVVIGRTAESVIRETFVVGFKSEDEQRECDQK